MWRITIEHNGRVESILQGDIPGEVAKDLRQQAERIRKEPYMMPRFDGEQPLDGLDLQPTEQTNRGASS